MEISGPSALRLMADKRTPPDLLRLGRIRGCEHPRYVSFGTWAFSHGSTLYSFRLFCVGVLGCDCRGDDLGGAEGAGAVVGS